MYRSKTLQTYIRMWQSECPQLGLWVIWIRRGHEVSGESGASMLSTGSRAHCRHSARWQHAICTTLPHSLASSLGGWAYEAIYIQRYTGSTNTSQQQTNCKREIDAICCQDRCLEMFLLILSLHGEEQCLKKQEGGVCVGSAWNHSNRHENSMMGDINY